MKLSGGETVRLLDLSEGVNFALIFLRHLGCPFCKEQVSELRDFGNRVIFVSMGGQEETETFRNKFRSQSRFVCDEKEELNEFFRIKRGGVRQVFGGDSFRRGMGALRKGHSIGGIIGNPWRLGGSFVLNPEGVVIWQHRNQEATDNAEIQDIAYALNSF